MIIKVILAFDIVPTERESDCNGIVYELVHGQINVWELRINDRRLPIRLRHLKDALTAHHTVISAQIPTLTECLQNGVIVFEAVSVDTAEQYQAAFLHRVDGDDELVDVAVLLEVVEEVGLLVGFAVHDADEA